MYERNQIREKATEEYLNHRPDILATACPLCKKTFAKSRQLLVQDISEIVYTALNEPKNLGINAKHFIISKSAFRTNIR